MYEVLAIVKNSMGDTIGYDLKDTNTGEQYNCVYIAQLSKTTFSNAMYINGKHPYIKGRHKLPIRVDKRKTTIFHGSNKEVREPLYGKGKSANDYGLGFYTTTEKERAEEWALLMSGDSFCNEYEIDTNGLTICNLDDFGPLAWIAEVLKNRGIGDIAIDKAIEVFCNKYCIDLSKVDIIIGYRADDSYFLIIKSFLANEISVEEVVQYFYKAKLGQQVFIKSKKAYCSKTIEDRRYKLITGGISLDGKMTFANCIQRNYKYDPQRRTYYEF